VEWTPTKDKGLLVRLAHPGLPLPALLELRFTERDLLSQQPDVLALASALEIVHYFSAATPLDHPPPERLARAYHLLLAGLPGMSDADHGNDRRSRLLATIDAGFMGGAALLAAGAMVQRTRFHDSDIDSLTSSRWLFAGAEVALTAALATKLWAFVTNH
jgi:hypothetical protein